MVHAINSTGKEPVVRRAWATPNRPAGSPPQAQCFRYVTGLAPTGAYRNCTISIRLSPEKGLPWAVKLC